ncbi:RNA exonuclease 1 homolog isoform X1 [Erpetoichthys calabaricus]|uniref:REX1, RNA exonuclease 1 homolog n=1 Tax=Erpetoichthys calabaricus TaxID=27687 RepID=A0A8C4TSC6_ERPCA|nr:RNA exonuclease 1 homolog isoform X1 [Erpetoichthys calabaricus]
MLRSTGFFRGIDCPFNSGDPEGRRCHRPYCHFRHSGSRRTSCSGREASLQDQGYDPYNPEIQTQGEENGDESISNNCIEVDSSLLELELVNRAIEAVKSEVEREQKKLSQFEDIVKAEYGSRARSEDSYGNLEYDPSSYQISAARGYNPTPLSDKYLLDTNNKTVGNSLEYVPTTVSRATKAKAVPLTCSKYTLDNSKPVTDLEYDPLSNYSAKLLSKKNSKGRNDFKRNHKVGQEENYVPIAKKSRLQTNITKYDAAISFSESDDESPVDYQPSPIEFMQEGRFSDDEMEDREMESKSRSSKGKESFDQGNAQEATRTDPVKEGKGDKKKSSSLADKKSSKADGVKSTDKKTTSKEVTKEKAKKEKPEKTVKGVTAEKQRSKEKVEKTKTSDKAKEKPKEKGNKEIKKVKKEGGEKPGKGSQEKAKDLPVSKSTMKGDGKDKKLEKGDKAKMDCKVTKDVKNGKPSSSNSSNKPKKTDSQNGSRDERKSGLLKKEVKAPPKAQVKHRTLSHADLFGDESDDDEAQRFTHRAVKKAAVQVSSSKRKASEFSSSSSSSSSSSEDDDGVDYYSLQNELDCDSDPMEECLRIFNESKEVKTEDKGRQAKQASKDFPEETTADGTLTTLFPGQKKRVSHFLNKGEVETPAPKQVIRPYRRPTPQEMCYQRMQIAQQQAAQLATAIKAEASSAAAAAAYPGEKKRIAHKPGPSTFITTKSGPAGTQQPGTSLTSPNKLSCPLLNVKAHTSAAILSKTTTTDVQKRIAHTPSLKSSTLKRPIIPAEFGGKVPTAVRQKCLNLLIDECLKCCPTEEEAFEKALAEEKVVCNRSSSRSIYSNVAANVLNKLRSLSSTAQTSTKQATNTPINKKRISHEEVLGGRLAAKTSFSIIRSGKQPEESLTGASLYRKLKPYIMTEEQLQENGYPRPNPDKPGKAIVFTATEKKSADPFTRVCCRCGSEYMVTVSGNCVRKEECNYHWGRLRRVRVPGGWETQYSCCSATVGSPGCQTAKQHVQDGRKENLDSFVKTFEKQNLPDGNPGVYALDCEMCYTRHGLELTRITVINTDLKVVYDTFVKPDSKVVDYNTRFSGVTEEDLENTTITIRDVQAVLLSMFCSDSILIGHSLESDLFALKLIHSTVVDTAIVFPHRLGPPHKRALRNLMADYLKRIIQDNVEGHDSSEDARACMELMLWKMKEDAKVMR